MKYNANKDELQHIASPFFREQFYGYFEGMDSEMAWRMIGGSHGYGTRQEMLLQRASILLRIGLKKPILITKQKTLKNIGLVLMMVLINQSIGWR